MVHILNWSWYQVSKTSIVTWFSSLTSLKWFSKPKMNVRFKSLNFAKQKLITEYVFTVLLCSFQFRKQCFLFHFQMALWCLTLPSWGRADGVQKHVRSWNTTAFLFYEKSAANGFPVQMSHFTVSSEKTGLTNGGLYAWDTTCHGRKDSLVCTCTRSQGW